MNIEWVPIILFLVLGFVCWSFVYFAYKGKKELQKTLQVALDKGEQLSNESIEKILASQRKPPADFKRGILLISFGVAIALFEILDPLNTGLYGLSFFPFAIGFGYLVVWKFDKKEMTDAKSVN